ncbi:Type I phosphodiesterase/nucleotide pyrophosphatase [Candidatus Sulfotelmatobacter kueseliae]|uniref:Type I phosphodiesterase/nucleotide pyrophosphatase n=1 Tax=Candidatus Sulfotelmatobacter kueseliae TaxID=2042962 RepID=A0A2U3L078_9BACT|nr:Type I phosphodiesterase/nucleotide pyrophosphatase [Candidatus Sulfotelmatobacter kueseliae]
MRSSPRSVADYFILFLLALAAVLSFSAPGFSSAYNGHPKLIVVIVIDQFRGDYLERYRDQFGDAGFRLLLDHGAYFPNCNFNYANTRTAPGHSTLFTGAYSNGHGIVANEWWDPSKKRMVTSVEDDATKLVGAAEDKAGASPHNLLADTLGDELKLATQGQSRVFALSLKDRAAVLPGGFAADAAYWIEPKTGAWVTSTYYRNELPRWVQDFNSSRPPKYWDREWKDAQGKLLGSTAHRGGKKSSDAGFYEVVGSTAFGNDYEFEFARELVVYENVGRGPATDLLSISLSPNDILGHQAGPDSPAMRQMALDLDRQLADFFNFLGHQIGLADVWIALSADHGVSAMPDVAKKLRIPAANLGVAKVEAQINAALTAKFSPGHAAAYVKLDYPLAWLDQDAFAAAHLKEREAERAVGEAMKQAGLRDFYTKSQLAEGEVPDTALGRKYLNSYSPEGGWYVMGVPDIYTVGPGSGTDHVSPYNYDTHVPLAIYGLPFQPGTYRTSVETVDLAPTLASLVGINAPTHSVGRVLTEALAPAHHAASSGANAGEGQP